MLWVSFSLPNKWFRVEQSPPSGWTNIVLNYIAPKNGEVIKIYCNGAEVARDPTKHAIQSTTEEEEMVSITIQPAGDGRIRRPCTNLDEGYDVAEIMRATVKLGGSNSAGDGRIVVGRLTTDRNEKHSSFPTDKLIFFSNLFIKSLYS